MGLSLDPEKRAKQIANLRKSNPNIRDDVEPKPKPSRKPLEVMDYSQQPATKPAPKPAKPRKPAARRPPPAAPRARRQPAPARKPAGPRGGLGGFVDGLLGRFD